MTTPQPSPPATSSGTESAAPLNAEQAALLRAVEARARAAKVFGAISVKASTGGAETLICAAANSAAPAEYRLFVDAGRWWIALVTPDRWLSESVESGMLEGRDKIEELIEEELVELGLEQKVEKVEHFRSPPPQKLYTFRYKVPAPQSGGAGQTAIDVTTTYLLATEAAFRQLGDMDAGPAEAD